MKLPNEIKMPVLNVILVNIDKIQPNDYNPNHVPPIELDLLELSIRSDGYTQPIVCYKEEETDTYTIVDGFHRYFIGKDRLKLKQLPIVTIDKPKHQRMGSTIRHNRARGVHSIQPLADIVCDLTTQGYSEEWISLNLGMSREEILKLKQSTGLKQAFVNHKFSESWEEFEEKYYAKDRTNN